MSSLLPTMGKSSSNSKVEWLNILYCHQGDDQNVGASLGLVWKSACKPYSVGEKQKGQDDQNKNKNDC